MLGAFGDIGVDALPRDLPLFPLSGALLLPHGHLPLNIFEPRYLNLVEDTLGRGRFRGMVQPRTPQADPVPDDAALYPVGCVGRIVSFEETETGHLFIALRGLSRFSIEGELDPEKGYRRARVDYRAYGADLHDDPGAIGDRPRLIAAVRRFFDQNDIEVDWEAIDEAADETLITSLAMICPFAPREKQALLESPGVTERADLLTTLIEMALLGDDGRAGTFHH